MPDEDDKRAADPLHVSLEATIRISASCNTAIEAFTTETAKRLAEVANAASDTEEHPSSK
jgi:hypothetical protein